VLDELGGSDMGFADGSAFAVMKVDFDFFVTKRVALYLA